MQHLDRNPILPASLEAVLAYVFVFQVLFEEAEITVFEDDILSAENTGLLPEPALTEYSLAQVEPLLACEETHEDEEYRA